MTVRKTIRVSFEQELLELATQQSKQQEISLSALINKLLREHFNK